MASGPEWFSQLDLTPDNLAIVESMYEQWLEDPDSVDASWRPMFESLRGHATGEAAVSAPPRFRPRSIFNPANGREVSGGNGADGARASAAAADATAAPTELEPGLTGRVATLIAYYRLHGHLNANIDPLGRERTRHLPGPAEAFSAADLATTLRCGNVFAEGKATLGQILERLRNTYTRTIGVEYMHIPQADRRQWLQQRMEWTENRASFTRDERLELLRKLTHGDALEQFLHTKYVGMKRFSIQGGEALLPGLDSLIEEAGRHGVREIVIGMAHRGRLAVLSSVLRKSAQEIFSEFERNPDPRATLGTGDVKYHMGFSHDHVTRDGHPVHLSLAFNPSHLEAVNPVVLGRVRAKEDRLGDRTRNRGMAVLLHGDAAFAGQGLVAETLQLSQIPGYSSGGAMHVVINNQIGFTTNPWESRSTTYATDVAHMLEIPIFHVNGNDVEALVHVVRLAMAYRQAFHTDVVIDLVCYRRYGHNEGDEPRFTQPTMYSRIDAQRSVREIYVDQLRDLEVVDADEADAICEQFTDEFSSSLEKVRAEPRRTEISQFRGVWAGYRGGAFTIDPIDTGIAPEMLAHITERLSTLPDHITPHRIVGRLLKQRAEMGSGERPIDWGMGESLAFGSLLLEGYPVRVSGQDSLRGTFGHRHAAIYDMDSGERYLPLQHLAADPDQARFQCYNSMLSEAAVLGFDYGYSMDTPEGLVIWEAQFGDFANNAQVIIDQFISSGEAKWRRLSGLVMLLPHGYEGQGPEHSSARLERFLQLCAMDNLLVCNVTTPAQFFHLLRRQVVSALRKPLIVMSPKSLLRHREAVSQVSDFTSGRFAPILGEQREDIDVEAVERVLLCSGKVYYDLLAEAQRRERNDVAIVRVEQLYPLAEEPLIEAIERFPNRNEIVWVQEEPRNMGAWHYMLPRLIELFGREPLPQYAGRMPSASPATGSPESHALEQEMFLEQAFA